MARIRRKEHEVVIPIIANSHIPNDKSLIDLSEEVNDMRRLSYVIVSLLSEHEDELRSMLGLNEIKKITKNKEVSKDEEKRGNIFDQYPGQG